MSAQKVSFSGCEVADAAVEPLRLLHLLGQLAPVLVHLPPSVLDAQACACACWRLLRLELGGERLVARTRVVLRYKD